MNDCITMDSFVVVGDQWSVVSKRRLRKSPDFRTVDI